MRARRRHTGIPHRAGVLSSRPASRDRVRTARLLVGGGRTLDHSGEWERYSDALGADESGGGRDAEALMEALLSATDPDVRALATVFRARTLDADENSDEARALVAGIAAVTPVTTLARAWGDCYFADRVTLEGARGLERLLGALAPDGSTMGGVLNRNY